MKTARAENFTAWADRAKGMTISELEWSIGDCIAAAKAMPEDGGWYYDELSAYRTELNNRRKNGGPENGKI
jgi:hypothetical protein